MQAFLEQIVVSVTNFLVTIILSRKLGVEEFGIYAVGFAVYVIAQGFQRAFICIPFAVLYGDEAYAGNNLCLWRRLNSQLGALLVLIAIFAFSLSWVFGRGYFVSSAIAIAVILYCGMASYEFYRRVLIQEGMTGSLLPAACLYALFANILIFFALDYFKYSVFAGVVVALSAYAASLYARSRPNLKARFKICIDDGQYRKFLLAIMRYGRWGGAGHIVFSAYNGLIPLVIGFSVGATASAYFNVSRNLLQPIQTLINAIDSVDKPKAARAFRDEGFPGLIAAVRSTLYVLIGVGGGYVLLVSVFADWVVGYIYGSAYKAAADYVVYWGGVFALMLMTQPLESMQYVLKNTYRLFLGRCAAGLAGVVTLFWLVPSHGLLGGLWALIVGWTVGLVASLILLVLSLQRAR